MLRRVSWGLVATCGLVLGVIAPAQTQGLTVETITVEGQPAQSVVGVKVRLPAATSGQAQTLRAGEAIPPGAELTFPRVLGHDANGPGFVPFETAVYKMTGLTAKTFALVDRGVLKPGFAADIAIFDAGAVDEAASVAKPMQAAKSIDTVIVNGAVVWREGMPTGARSGQLNRGQRC